MPRISLPSIRLPRITITGTIVGISTVFLIGAVLTVGNDPGAQTVEPTLPATAPNTVVVTEPPTTTAAPTTTIPATTTTTTIVPAISDPNLPCQEWLPLALQVGWPNDPEVLSMLLRVMNRESRCRPEARSKTSDTGLLQLNDYWCEPSRYTDNPSGWLGDRMALGSCADLTDPAKNLQGGLLIWYYSETKNGNGWHPWRFSGPTG
jgi:hypothetical protein